MFFRHISPKCSVERVKDKILRQFIGSYDYDYRRFSVYKQLLNLYILEILNLSRLESSVLNSSEYLLKKCCWYFVISFFLTTISTIYLDFF